MTTVTIVFLITYLVMALGRLPGTRINRTGIALIGAMVLLGGGIVPLQNVEKLVELPVLLTLFSLMIIGAHLQHAQAFSVFTARMTHPQVSPKRMLLVSLALSSGFSLVLVNDIVVFALAPLLCEICAAKKINPKPHLLGLAFAANAGSSASLIGNPQNILLADVGQLSLINYALFAGLPALTTVVIIYAVLQWVYRDALVPTPDKQNTFSNSHAVDRFTTILSLVALVVVVGGFIVAPGHGYQVALTAAAGLSILGRMHTATLLKDVDINLLIMMTGLFIVTGAFANAPAVTELVASFSEAGWLPTTQWSAALFSLLSSNTIGNVPAVMLLLKLVDTLPQIVFQWLALFTTLAGNLLITGSLANIITAERAAQQRVFLTFNDFARVGIPITLLSMAAAYLWLWLFSSSITTLV